MQSQDPILDALQASLEPDMGEHVRVRELVLSQIKLGPRNADDLWRDVVADAGLYDGVSQLEDVELGQDFDEGNGNRNHPTLRHYRMKRVFTEVLDELRCRGTIVGLENELDDDASKITIWLADTNSTRRGYRVPLPVPAGKSKAYRLALSSRGDIAQLEPLDQALFLNGLEPLLGVRGIDCLQQSLLCWRQGLYLASVGMLGAASEAAWYSVATKLREKHDKQLNEALTAGNTAKVISLTVEKLKLLRPRPHGIEEIYNNAAYLRDLRNYTAHPADFVSTDHESTFTEAMVAVLLASTRRIFLRLIDAVESSNQ